MARRYTLADGQLAAASATLLAGSSLDNLDGECVDISCTNTAATTETVVITLTRTSSGTARRIARAVLAQNEELVVTGLKMQGDDTLSGVTTNASAVDYLVTGGSTAPFGKNTYDSNGALKSTNATASGTVTGFVVVDDGLGAFGTGSTARFSYDTTDANANALLLQLPAGGAVDVPVLAVGQSIESVDLGLYNGVVDPRIALFGVGAVTTGCILEFRKARGSITSPTVCTTGDDLGSIDFYGCVAAGEYVRGASIRADISGTIATTRGPGNLSFNVATDAAPSVLTERLLLTGSGAITLTAATDVLIANGTGLVVGHTAQITAGAASEFQVLGSALADSSAILGAFSADAVGPDFQFVKSRHATVGSNTIVQDNDECGRFVWLPADGADFATEAAVFQAEVDDASPAAGDVGMAFVWESMPGGAGAIREVMRIAATGDISASSALSGAVKSLILTNTSDDASAGALIQVTAGGSSASADAALSAIETGSHEIRIGIDTSSSIGVISMSSAFGTKDVIRITDAAPPVITYNTTHPTGTFDYVCDGCGKSAPEEFECCGAVKWHDDVLALAPMLAANDGGALMHSTPGIKHMAKLGILDLTHDNDGNEEVFMRLDAAQWFTWSALNQLYKRVGELETKSA